MNFKLLFLSPVRYPTEKAYGVTTGNTVKALRYIGKNIEIWNESNTGIDEYGNPLVAVGKKHLINRKYLYRTKFLGIDRWMFYLDQLLFSLKCLKRLSKEKDLLQIWSRFPLVNLICCLRRNVNLTVIELHHQPNRAEQLFIKVVRQFKPVTVAVISRTAEEQFKSLNLDVPTVVLEMAVPNEFIQNPKIPLTTPITICFLGKSQSSGHSNDLEFVIEAFSLLHNLEEVMLEIIGVEDQAASTLSQLVLTKKIPQKNVKFISHLPHAEISEFLDSVSIGLVPYEFNKYNSGRFPIKIMEYAAKGIWIMAPEKFTKNLDVQPNVVFSYRDGDAGDLAQSLEILSREISTSRNRNESAIHFAKSHTYISRATKLAAHVDQLSFKKGL